MSDMVTIREEDLIESVADALQYISYYHPMDYIRALGEVSAAAVDHQRLVGGGRPGFLQHHALDHRRGEMAAVPKRDRAVDIGEAARGLGHEVLACDRAHAAQHEIGIDPACAELAVDHRPAGCVMPRFGPFLHDRHSASLYIGAPASLRAWNCRRQCPALSQVVAGQVCCFDDTPASRLWAHRQAGAGFR